ncbi:MAG: TIM barrel protein [Bryobacteraceae bacterium]
MTITRRESLAMTAAALATRLDAADSSTGLKGAVNHSVCRWCYGKIPLEELAASSKKIGLRSIELLGPKEWPVVAQYGLTCAMTTAPNIDGLGGITKAFNRVEHHDKLVQVYEEWIPLAAKAGLQNLICFSGNRDGQPDDVGIENCAKGLKRLMSACEKNNVTMVMELLNSKVNHKDYQCDHTEWGVELAKRIGSERFKLLYDIYHMQIMEGDVIATIKKHHGYIAHYHTGGVPGRHEIDDTQELHYPAIMKAILDTGFKGFVAQEFIPARPEALKSLEQGVRICDV